MLLSTRMKIATALTAAVSAAALLGNAATAQAVVGGKAVTKGTFDAEYQFMVQITTGATTSSGRELRCGGVLVAPDKVVTSFACLNTGDGQQATTKVVGGTTDFNGNGGTVSGVVDAINSADYRLTDDGVPVADVALLTLAEEMPYTPVELVPESYTPEPGTDARVLGWGDTKADPSYSKQLREGDLEILSDSTCESAYTGNNFLSDTMLCAGKEKGGVDFASGDEGGPLLVTQGDKQYLAGIASWGYKEPGVAGKPGVYTDISAFRWVTEY